MSFVTLSLLLPLPSRLRQGFRLRQGYGGQDGGQAGERLGEGPSKHVPLPFGERLGEG
jgi:hypothetical protein